MKKLYLVLGILLAMGIPFIHGLSGKDWGMAVKGLATSEPMAVSGHLNLEAGGMPAAHGVSGKDWGMAVKNMALSEPGAVADHINL